MSYIDKRVRSEISITQSEYWILDYTSRSYDLREEIKRFGGRWNPDHKTWSIITDPENQSYKTLVACGLKLQFRRKV